MTGRLTLPQEIYNLIRDEVLKAGGQQSRCDRDNPVNGPFNLDDIEMVPGPSMNARWRWPWQ